MSSLAQSQGEERDRAPVGECEGARITVAAATWSAETPRDTADAEVLPGY
jgi:hypothetical protein